MSDKPETKPQQSPTSGGDSSPSEPIDLREFVEGQREVEKEYNKAYDMILGRDSSPEAPERTWLVTKNGNSPMSTYKGKVYFENPGKPYNPVEYVRADLAGKLLVSDVMDARAILEVGDKDRQINELRAEVERLEHLAADRTQYNIGKKFGLLEGQMDERRRIEEGLENLKRWCRAGDGKAYYVDIDEALRIVRGEGKP